MSIRGFVVLQDSHDACHCYNAAFPSPAEFPSMRAFVSGQIGVDKGPYLNAVQALARKNGVDLAVCHLGQMMYAEAPDVPQGRILNLPITRLNTLRRAAFKEILRIADKHEHVLVNTHATFRWRHGPTGIRTGT